MLTQLAYFLTDNAAWVVAGSVLSLLISSVLSTLYIAQLPVDYFVAKKRQLRNREHWVVRLILILIKNAIGLILIAAGFLMLFTPGQGLLTLIAGLLLTDFPGKFTLERWIARQKSVMRALNWLREKRRQPPFLSPDSDEA